MDIAVIYDRFVKSKGVSTDTRSIKEGEIYVALKGDNFDGNVFVADALKKGASSAFTSDESLSNDEVIYVPDTLQLLQELAAYHIDQLDIPVIGITGSNGKTTTKELLRKVLSKKYRVLATKGNLNNHIGVPLTVLSITNEIELAIIEMGANHLGEIKLLSSIAQPDYAVITNIGKAHLEGFGNLDGVLDGKTELYENVSSRKGTIFYNVNSQKLISRLPSNTTNIPYGENIDYKHIFPYLQLSIDDNEYKSSLIGKYNAINIACAVTVGKYFDIPVPAIKEAISQYEPKINRSQLIHQGSNLIISDCYNANPESMQLSIENFTEVQHSNKVLILGEMLEVGTTSKKEHQNIIHLISDQQFNDVVLVGNEFYQLDTEFKKFLTVEDVLSEYDFSRDDTMYLLKGSRGNKLEKLIPHL